MLRDHWISTLILLAGIASGFFGSSIYSALWTDSDQNHNSADREGPAIIFSGNGKSESLVEKLTANRLLYIGEHHDRLDHHLNQLKIIKRLNETGIDFSIGLESFQHPYQQHLGAYINGDINEKMLLKLTGYFKNWGYDFRFYRPVITYARENGIQLLALNAPSELVDAVSRNGLGGLEDSWENQLPIIRMTPDNQYKVRLKSFFKRHPTSEKSFERFLDVQLLWDEYMAESLVSYLKKNPNRKIVVLAGTGHVAGGIGIPERVYSRLPAPYQVLLNVDSEESNAEGADYMLLTQGYELPATGRLGLYITEDGKGVLVRKTESIVIPNKGSIVPGDRILHIAGESVKSIEDVRIALLDRQPGEQVWIELERNMIGAQPVRVAAKVELN